MVINHAFFVYPHPQTIEKRYARGTSTTRKIKLAVHTARVGLGTGGNKLDGHHDLIQIIIKLILKSYKGDKDRLYTNFEKVEKLC